MSFLITITLPTQLTERIKQKLKRQQDLIGSTFFVKFVPMVSQVQRSAMKD
jgi:hypothetical protein